MKRTDLLLIDGKNLLWRSASVFDNLFIETDDDQVISTGGIYGFMHGLLAVHQKYRGRLVICWDGKRNFRKALYPDYKKKRVMTPEDLERYVDVEKQLKRVQALLRRIGIEQLVAIRCEADDVIGTLCHENRNKRIVIFSGDSDMRQLVNRWVTVVSPGKGRNVIYDSRTVENKHQIGPELIPDLKALAGDSSDGIPGISGIGPQKAVALLKEFGTLEGVVNAAKDPNFWEETFWPVSQKLRVKITEGVSDLALFKILTTIKVDAKYKEIKPKKDLKMVARYLKLYDMKTFYSPVELKKLSMLSRYD